MNDARTVQGDQALHLIDLPCSQACGSGRQMLDRLRTRGDLGMAARIHVAILVDQGVVVVEGQGPDVPMSGDDLDLIAQALGPLVLASDNTQHDQGVHTLRTVIEHQAQTLPLRRQSQGNHTPPMQPGQGEFQDARLTRFDQDGGITLPDRPDLIGQTARYCGNGRVGKQLPAG